MLRFRSKKRRASVLMSVLVLCLLLAAGYALTAANIFTANGKAGDGTTVISGYTVASVAYTLSASDPTKIASWTITMAGGQGTVSTLYSRLTDVGGIGLPSAPGWVTCTPNNSAGPFTCTPAAGSQPGTAAAINIQIAASS
ncbi:MAG: hypothetical protein ACXVYM_07415 [Gaiellaceae bacterium]